MTNEEGEEEDEEDDEDRGVGEIWGHLWGVTRWMGGCLGWGDCLGWGWLFCSTQRPATFSVHGLTSVPSVITDDRFHYDENYPASACARGNFEARNAVFYILEACAYHMWLGYSERATAPISVSCLYGIL